MKQDFAPLDTAILSALKHGPMPLDEIYGTELILHHCWRLRNQLALKTGKHLAADSFLSDRLKLFKEAGKIHFSQHEGWSLVSPK